MVLNRTEVKEKLFNVLIDITDKNDLKADADFKSQNIVSLDMLELGWFIESEYGIVLDTDELRESETLDGLVDLVVK